MPAVTLTAWAQDQCGPNFAAAAHPLDDRYEEMLAQKPERKIEAQTTHVLLREAFWPLLNKFRSAVDETSDAKIRALLEAGEKESQIEPAHFASYARTLDMPVVHLTEGAMGTGPALAGDVVDASQKNSARLVTDSVFAKFLKAKRKDVEGAFENASKALWLKNPTRLEKFGEAASELSMEVTPVGAYGPDFSRDLLRTTQVMLALARENLEPESKWLAESSPKLLSKETARFQDSPEGMGPLNSFSEGIVTFHQLISSVLANRVPGAETGAAALHDFIFKGDSRMGLTAEYTSRLPIGFMGPMTLSGTHFKTPLLRKPDGQLALSEEVQRVLQMAKGNMSPRRKFGVCPFASLFRGKSQDPPKAGLQVLAETYWRVFESVSEARKLHNFPSSH